MRIMKPAEIERESMRIIEQELSARGIRIPAENAAVVKRVIHTTADFDYAENLVFTENAVTRACAYLRRSGASLYPSGNSAAGHGDVDPDGPVIVTDTNMAKSGVSRPAMKKLGAECLCFMAEQFIAEEAKKRGVTRAVVSMEHALKQYPGAALAVGNAPTALFAISEAIEQGARPALVVGVPVGFVNVVESKERLLETCRRHDVPAIVARGRKGGSTVAAAVLNALLYAAAEMAAPEKRM